MKTDGKKIQVIFPGVGYHADKPLLYYGRKIACEAGFDECIRISYSCPVDRIRGDKEKMRIAFASMYEQAEKQLLGIPWDAYSQVLFVSKSIGTAIAVSYAKKQTDREVMHLLYTPLSETLSILADTENIHATAFIGSADPWSSASDVVDMAGRLGIPIHLYEGANHSLETGDSQSDLRILGDVMDKSRAAIMDFQSKKM